MKAGTLIFILLLWHSISIAQYMTFYPEKTIKKRHQVSFASASDGIMLSSAYRQSPAIISGLTYLRASLFFNIVSLNYDFDKVGLFSQIDLNNIGYIFKTKDSTLKARAYTISVPIGIKLGNVKKHGNYLMTGGGTDFPFNYKEKNYHSSRYNKQKFNEWFSDRNPTILPFVYIGCQFQNGISIKAQYYFTDFYNTTFNVNNITPSQPYSHEMINIAAVLLGYNIDYAKLNKKDPEDDF